jgi:hypothetical protein
VRVRVRRRRRRRRRGLVSVVLVLAGRAGLNGASLGVSHSHSEAIGVSHETVGVVHCFCDAAPLPPDAVIEPELIMYPVL